MREHPEENPYQSPQSSVEGPWAGERGGPAARGVLQQALKVSLCQQVPLLAFSSLILDGGVVLARVVTAVLAYWVVTLFILLARRWRVSAYDRLFLKWGFFLLLAASFLWQAITAH